MTLEDLMSEIDAKKRIIEILQDFNPAVIDRIIRWLAEVYKEEEARGL